MKRSDIPRSFFQGNDGAWRYEIDIPNFNGSGLTKTVRGAGYAHRIHAFWGADSAIDDSADKGGYDPPEENDFDFMW